MKTLNKTLVITQKKDQAILMAILDGTKAVELRLSPPEEKERSLVGNIYIGKVRRVQKNIDSAFVEIANHTQCYYSIPANPNPFYTKKGNSSRIIEGDELLVQVKRDGLKTKLPAVSGNIELAGQYLILVGNDTQIGISGKLSAESRKQLRGWMEPFVTERYGFIVRTNAGTASREEIEKEAHSLAEQYENLLHHAPYRTCFSLLKGPDPAWIEMMRDTYLADLEKIVTDVPLIYDSLHRYLQQNQPQLTEHLQLYQDDLLPLIKLYRLEHAIEEALKEQVWLKSGGYLVIQPTEALTVIDVNTGKYSEKKVRRETLRKINLEAAAESARQIRLRNLSGIILIDFINMEQEEDKKELMEYLSQLLLRDPVKTRLIDMTKLELVEITRKKVRKTLREQVASLKVSNNTTHT